MTDIPEDVMKAAREAWRSAWNGPFGKETETIARAIMAECERSQWQPIETAPKDGTAIDIWGANKLHPRQTGRRSTNVTWGRVCDWMGRERDDWQHGLGEDFEPTHWMPTPSSPPEAS